MNKEFEKLLPNKKNCVTLKVPFSTMDAAILADAMKIEDLGNYDKSAEYLDNALMMYDKESATWAMHRDIYVDSISNEDGEVTMNGLVKVDNLSVDGVGIDEFISDKVQQYGLTITEGDGIDIVDIDPTSEEASGLNTKKIGLAEVDDLGEGTVGSPTKIPVISYDKFGRIISATEVDISNQYYTKDEVLNLIQTALRR